MSRTIVIVGFGPGVSTSVATKFGAEGFSVALIARNPARLAEGVDALKRQGINAAGFPADAGDPASLRSAIARVRAEFGPIVVVHWNAYTGYGTIDLLAVDPASLHALFDLTILGLLNTVQEALPDLIAAKDGAVLVTNGAYGELNPFFDTLALAANAAGVALGNAAKAKLVGLLAARLKGEGVYVGEVTIAGSVTIDGLLHGKEPGADSGPTVDSTAVAEAFWRLYASREDVRARVG